MNKYEQAARNQGFDLSISDSPIDTPEGWHDGSVHQTGGMIMVRIWSTWDGHTGEYSGRDTEYQCAYGENAGVSIQRFVWDDNLDGYAHDSIVENQSVSENTDQRKAEVAKELMENFDRDDD